MSEASFRIWIDADACPAAIKEVLFRASRKRRVKLVLVANSRIATPKSDLIDVIAVPHGADVADKEIVRRMRPGDVVVTGDIPLAAEVVKKGGLGIGTRGQLFDDSSVQGYLASRNIGEQMRSAGMETRGPRPHSSKDTQAFANQLDRILTKRLNADRS